MLKIFSNAEYSPGSYKLTKIKSPSQASGNISNEPYAPTLSQHASPNIPEPPDPVSTALPTRYTSIADYPIAELNRLDRQIARNPNRFTSEPLTTRPSDLGALSATEFSTVSQFDLSPQLDDFDSSPEQSRYSSPTRSNRFSALSGKSEGRAGRLADWFKGQSNPIRIGIIPSPVKEKSDPLDFIDDSSATRTANLRQRQSSTQIMARPTMASRFSFFSSKASLVKSKPSPNDLGDELLEMDVTTALFPDEPANPFSPASFKNLQQQAEGLLSRLQTAYKERTVALRDMTAEKETIAEESEGAAIRARHLKIQLDDMTAKFAEQDQAMMNLVDELAQEKQSRREDEEARKKTIRVVRDVASPSISRRGLSRSNTVSDSGFESEDDSSADSVFSRRNGANSPILSISSTSTTNSPDAYRTHEFHAPASAAQLALLRLPQGQPATKGMPVHPYTNCENVRASEAWNIVNILKEENEELKHRVGELEGALDGCLDVVGRLS